MPRRRPRLLRACSTDLKQRGLLDDTLVIWGGEFGRTVYSQGGLSATNYGRDHHPKCFTVWMAGGGIKPGARHGETDDFSYNVADDAVHVRDLNATILHCLGIDHEKLTYKFQGLDQKLTGVIPRAGGERGSGLAASGRPPVGPGTGPARAMREGLPALRSAAKTIGGSRGAGDRLCCRCHV